MNKQYKNPALSRTTDPPPAAEFSSDVEGYKQELQYRQLHTRDIDPSSLIRKSEGELMKTIEANNLVGTAFDQLQMDQLRTEPANESPRESIRFPGIRTCPEDPLTIT